MNIIAINWFIYIIAMAEWISPLSFHLFNLNEALWMRVKISFKKRVDVQLPWIEFLSDCDMGNWEPTLTCTFDCFIAFQIVTLCPNVLYFSQIQK